ncbi:enterochelin esterase domain-containing protein [Leucobacter japonicus]|uniref:enterochelin esterase domain-containing protein n=1 Tax=Leucobacter japonicus TaxID=1461259 RepID=UPI0006A79E65|nr:enterochelin esterase domain-containing protein [Leucobacter japonicus]
MNVRTEGMPPTRAQSAIWRRVLAGESPDLVSPVWSAFGERVELNGEAHREVVFVAEAEQAGDRVMIHLNGTTDAHRTDIRPAVLDAVPDSSVRVIDYLLPEDLIASYRFVSLPAAELPDDAGATRAGWLRVHDAGAPDPRNPRRLPNPLGRWSSVLIAPGAVEHPAWRPAAMRTAGSEPFSSLEETSLPLGGEFADRVATLLIRPSSDDSAARLLVLFDGENWERVGIREALAHSAGAVAPSAMVLVPSGSLEQRSAVLPHPDRVADLLSAVLAALRTHAAAADTPRILAVPTPDRIVVAGQSYGGLAAAAIVALRPDLATTAVVQSGSFHFRASEAPRPPAGETGDLVDQVSKLAGTNALSGRRFLVQSGTEETGMTESAAHFAEAARDAGAQIDWRVYAGGHDYAWWRTGLFDALDALTGGSAS